LISINLQFKNHFLSISFYCQTLLQNCLPNTLDTTVLHASPDLPDSFIITGDIEALWLRDSTNQILPYVPYASQDPALALLVEGLISRQANSVLIDPFANAFNYNASGAGHQDDIRRPSMTKGVFEGKYEIDSPAAFLKISYWYWRYTDATTFMTSTWNDAVSNLSSTSTDLFWLAVGDESLGDCADHATR
jgi:uncharacterized protein